MKRRIARRLTAVTLAGIIAAGLTVCASAEGATEGEKSSKGGHLFGYTCMDLTNPFHIAMRDAIKEAIEANGDSLVDIDGKMDQTTQTNAIEDMITQGIDALFLNPVDSSAVSAALEECKNADIPVINVDSGVDDKNMIATYISSNNYVAGQQCGEEIVKLFPDGCNICIIENPLADSVVQRVKGLEDAIDGTDCKIIDRKSISTMDQVLQNAEDILTANEDIDVFWGLNDDVSLIILGAVESAGRQDEIKVMSVDGSPSGKKSVADGGLYCTAAQSPVSIGKKAVECAYDILDGKDVDTEYSIDTVLITPDNIGDYSVDTWN